MTRADSAWDQVERRRRQQQAELLKLKRSLLDELIGQLTPSERGKFVQIFHSKAAAGVKAGDLRRAMELCEATIKKHRDRILDVIVEKLDD